MAKTCECRRWDGPLPDGVWSGSERNHRHRREHQIGEWQCAVCVCVSIPLAHRMKLNSIPFCSEFVMTIRRCRRLLNHLFRCMLRVASCRNRCRPVSTQLCRGNKIYLFRRRKWSLRSERLIIRHDDGKLMFGSDFRHIAKLVIENFRRWRTNGSRPCSATLHTYDVLAESFP